MRPRGQPIRLLCDAIGRSRTIELLLTGRNVDAAETLRIGLVHEVVPFEAREEAVGIRTSHALVLARFRR